MRTLLVALMMMAAGCITPEPAGDEDDIQSSTRPFTDEHLGFWYEEIFNATSTIAPSHWGDGQRNWQSSPYTNHTHPDPERFRMALIFEGDSTPSNVTGTIELRDKFGVSEPLAVNEDWLPDTQYKWEFDRGYAVRITMTTPHAADFNIRIDHAFDEKIGRACRTYHDNNETVCWNTNEWGEPNEPPNQSH